ncbi:MAG: hypothetical protein OXI77_17885 [Chloroflexota bacterium]|nr:hypothetical protein [Chloroflexota bacterium]MDE2908591.1 hypothetical protein [Chloroflexota bacterium]
MIEKLLPQPVTNQYSGHPLAKRVFVVLTLITIGRSLVHMFAADGGAQSIASIALDAFTDGGASTVITIFALWGLSQLIIGLLYAIALWRYQSLIPLMYVFFAFEYFMRLIAGFYSPGLEKLETAPGEIGNIIFLPLGIVMLWLSLRENQA